jgi:hypothetical protein
MAEGIPNASEQSTDIMGLTSPTSCSRKSSPSPWTQTPYWWTRKGACIVNNDQIRIGCRDTDLSCIYSGGNFFWAAPTKLERCRFHQIRRSTGIVVSGSNGTETFISRDGSMIRLLLRRPAQLCGEATGFRTNYDNLYLMDEIYEDQVSDTLPLGEVSTITYANQQDGFLFGEMSAHVNAEFGRSSNSAADRNNIENLRPSAVLGKRNAPTWTGIPWH